VTRSTRPKPELWRYARVAGASLSGAGDATFYPHLDRTDMMPLLMPQPAALTIQCEMETPMPIQCEMSIHRETAPF